MKRCYSWAFLSILWKPVGHWKSSHCLFFSSSNCKRHLEMVLLSSQTRMDSSRCDWADWFCKSSFSCQFLKFIIISVLKIVLMIYFHKLRRINLAIFFNRYLFQDSSVEHFRWKAELPRSLKSFLLQRKGPHVLPWHHRTKSWVNKPCKLILIKKKAFLTFCLAVKGLPCPPLSSPPVTHIHPRNSLYPIATKYIKTKGKPASFCRISTIKFTSCFHSNTPGKHSISFALWGKHTPAVLTFMKNLHWALHFLRSLNFSLSLIPK